jgi:hypothetical protein
LLSGDYTRRVSNTPLEIFIQAIRFSDAAKTPPRFAKRFVTIPGYGQ